MKFLKYQICLTYCLVMKHHVSNVVKYYHLNLKMIMLLLLNIKENCIVDIKTALESTFCDEIIDFPCNHCGHNLASVKNFIATTSDYLVIQLKRFKFISKKQQTKKLFKKILSDSIIELKCCGGRSLYE